MTFLLGMLSLTQNTPSYAESSAIDGICESPPTGKAKVLQRDQQETSYNGEVIQHKAYANLDKVAGDVIDSAMFSYPAHRKGFES